MVASTHRDCRPRGWSLAHPALVLACCFLLTAKQASNDKRSEQAGRISGRVSERTSGVPIEGADITILERSSDPGSKRNYRTADTLPDGSFAVNQLPAGKYLVSAGKDGYVERSRLVTLGAGGEESLRFSLSRTGSISGRIVDDHGNGVPGLRVGAWATAYRYGRATIEPRGFASSGKNGEFLVERLRRGSYLVGVLSALLKPNTTDRPQDQLGQDPVYARSFYSDADSLADAIPISLEDEQQLTGIEIRARKTSGYCITASLPESVPKGTEVTATLVRGASPSEPNVGTGVLNYAGVISFCGVPSGDYIFYASLVNAQGTINRIGVEPVSVDKRNIRAVALSLEESKELRGQIITGDGQPIDQHLPSIGLRLEPVDRWPFAGEDVTPRVDYTRGTFSFPRVYPGKYWVDVTRISSGFYVSRISAGRRDAIREPIQAGDGDLNIVVRSDGPSLSGTVTSDSGGELPASVIVVLKATSSPNTTPIRSTHIDQAGQFSFDNLAPGKYELLALSDLNSEDAENPLVINQFSTKAIELDLMPHSAQRVELHPIPAL